MKRIIVLLILLLHLPALSQSYSSNLRRVSREIDKVMAVTSDIIDGTMTFEKSRKVQPFIEEQSKTWRKSQRSLDRLDEAPEAELLAAVNVNVGGLIEITQENLKYWFQEDPRSSYGYTYVAEAGSYLNAVIVAMDAYAEQYDITTRTSEELERFQTQMELFRYTKEMKRGANEVDSLVGYLQSEIGSIDMDALYTAQKALVKTLSKELRGYGEERFFNGQTELHEAYQKYYIELLELASADILADLTKMRYDLVEFNSIASSTEISAKKTLSFFDNEMRLLTKREARFVKRNLPKAPKR
ncbi:MAG: hypothetical protein L7U67_00485 [Schleiferiaceae bacterium]|nr:hypothetical protein [Schleiferiaceae bacterium]